MKMQVFLQPNDKISFCPWNHMVEWGEGPSLRGEGWCGEEVHTPVGQPANTSYPMADFCMPVDAGPPSLPEGELVMQLLSMAVTWVPCLTTTMTYDPNSGLSFAHTLSICKRFLNSVLL